MQFINIKRLVPLAIVLFLHGAVSAEEPATAEKISKGAEMADNDNLLEALEYFRELELLMPGHPGPVFFQVAVIEKIQVDYMSSYMEDEFLRLIKKGLSTARKYLDANPRDAFAYFFLGGMQGYNGLHTYRREHKMAIFYEAVRAVRNLKKAREMMPELWDIYYGLGCYKYWKAKKAKFLYVFNPGGMTEDREEGIKMLRLAHEKGVYGSTESGLALIRVLINEGRLEEASSVVEENLAAHPLSAVNTRFRQEILLLQKNWAGLLEESARMEKLLSSKPYTGPDAWIHLYYNMGYAAMEMGDNLRASRYFNTVVRYYKISRDSVEIYKNLAGRAGKFLKKLQKGVKEHEN